MDELVLVQNNQAVTTSLKIAETFGKAHRGVIRDIKNLVAQNRAVKKMFSESTYKNSRNQEYKMYYMNFDGFALLAMGFTGKRALDFKLTYINEFNRMRDMLSKSNWKRTVLPTLADKNLYTSSFIAGQFNITAYDLNHEMIKAGLIQFNSKLNCYVICPYYRSYDYAKLVNYYNSRNHMNVKWLKWTSKGRQKVQELLLYVGYKTDEQQLLDERHLDAIQTKGTYIMTDENKNIENEEEAIKAKKTLDYKKSVQQRYDKIMKLPSNDWNNLMKQNAEGLLRNIKKGGDEK